MASSIAPAFRGELWLDKKLSALGVHIHSGLTDYASRKAKARHAIVTQGLATVIAGRGPDGRPQTYAEVFRRVYSEPLEITDQHENGDGV